MLRNTEDVIKKQKIKSGEKNPAAPTTLNSTVGLLCVVFVWPRTQLSKD